MREERTLLRTVTTLRSAGRRRRGQTERRAGRQGEEGKNEWKERNRHAEWDNKIVAARIRGCREGDSGTLHSSGRGDGSSSSSAAEDAAERRLGRGRKAPARRRPCCEDGGGRTRDASARLIWSPPSTAAMRTSGFAIDARRGALSLLDTGAAAACPRCRAQRKEPGCVVGEHAHDGAARLRGGAGTGGARFGGCERTPRAAAAEARLSRRCCGSGTRAAGGEGAAATALGGLRDGAVALAIGAPDAGRAGGEQELGLGQWWQVAADLIW
ncbi:hypothetical protein C2845_PM13G04170 [Panicum miliaceum]|uniref:Uncharacterized protein n=1 Tax=Panicum miliaceum TaxID=4540 RepID=A0A3L6RLK7_PANMI|nr:hypothetical protein C2845_PM13G04170 [Panicum miliaceum]